MLRILAVGDVVGAAGLTVLSRHLRRLISSLEADFCIVNGENAAGVGLKGEHAFDIFDAGADVITLGNHAFAHKSVYDVLDENDYILRPANFAPQAPGRGAGLYEAKGRTIRVLNLIGRCEMKFGPDNPFLLADKLLAGEEADITVVDFHAGATSEKLAMGFYLDGRVSCVFGTHTHVPTADERVLPKGTGYITDIGMTGPYMSVLGVRPEQSIAMFRGDMTSHFKEAEGPAWLCGALFSVDEASGRCASVERVCEII